MRTISRDFRTLFGAGALGGLTDGQLLDRFLARREEAAFEEIVRRHGPMVWGVCRRILRRHHDAEDAFQATFLVLARKGASVSPREKLPNWLYGVAVQTALKARVLIARRLERERQVTVMPEPIATADGGLPDDLGVWLDRELSRLPEKYRVPIVLCDLEGESHRAAAGRLGWPIGTLAGRLSRARAILARRLNRRGQGFSAGTVAFLLAREAESAWVPPLLARSTARAACLAANGLATELVSAQVAALTEGVLTGMVFSQVRVATAGLLMAGLVGLCLGMSSGTAGALESQAETEGAESRGGDPTRPGEDKPRSPQSDLELLQGIWFGTVVESGGHRLQAEGTRIPPQVKLIVKGERMFLRGPKLAKTVSFGTIEDTELAITLDLADAQGTIDLTCLPAPAGERPLTYRGIYSLSKARFEVCLDVPGAGRPREFKTKPRTSQVLIVLSPARIQDDGRDRRDGDYPRKLQPKEPPIPMPRLEPRDRP